MSKLTWLTALPAALLLFVACTPGTSSGTSGSAPSGSSGNVRTDLAGPLKAGEVWKISGLDQNNNKLEGKVTVVSKPEYNVSQKRWDYDSALGSVTLYESAGTGIRFVAWDYTNAKRYVACFIFEDYSPDKKAYSGAGLAGTEAEIEAVFAKLSGSGTKLVGGDCKITRP